MQTTKLLAPRYEGDDFAVADQSWEVMVKDEGRTTVGVLTRMMGILEEEEQDPLCDMD